MIRLLRKLIPHPVPSTGTCPACVTAQSFGHNPGCEAA